MSASVVFLSTHADRQGVDLSIAVCLCVCTVTDFSAEDKASGVKFCMAVRRRPRQGMSHFCELCSTRSPKSDELASVRVTRAGLHAGQLARGLRPPSHWPIHPAPGRHVSLH